MSRRYSSFDQVVFCYVHTWLFCWPFLYQNNGIKSYGSFFLQCPTDGLDRERSLVILEVVWENWTFVTLKVVVTADCVGWCSSISLSLRFNGNTSWQVPIFRFIFICNFVQLVATLHVYPGAQHSYNKQQYKTRNLIFLLKRLISRLLKVKKIGDPVVITQADDKMVK